MTKRHSRWRASLGWIGKTKVTTIWIAVVTASLFLAVTVYEALTYGLSAMLTQLVYLPILLAAAVLGLRGGTVVGLLIAVTMGPIAALGPGEGRGEGLWWAKSSLYLLFGITVGALFQSVDNRLRRVEQRANRLSEMYTKTLSSLAHTVEVRDRHTQGHSERVARNAMVLGREVGFSERHLELLYWSALLHDLGKIAIPDYILLKDGPLTKREYDEVKQHPVYGAELLSSLSSEFAPIAEIVRSHHERWDGLGYPNGTRGGAIPLMSRIISIVDVFEALTSERPYRKPMTTEEALEFVLEATGQQFDPTLVQVFQDCFGRGHIRAATEQPLAAGPQVMSPRVFVTHITA